MKFAQCKTCQSNTMWFVFFGNAFIMTYLYLLGLITGSAALKADAIHASADVLSTIITMLSIKFSNKPADELHAYGYGKIQYISSMLTGLLLLSASIMIFTNAFKTMLSGQIAPPNPIALFGAAVAIFINEVMYRNQVCLATQISSPAVMANAWDNRSDAISSVGVLIGVSFAVFGFPLADPLTAVCVSLVILKIAYSLNVEGLKGLLDTTADTDTLKLIYQVTRKTPGVLGISYVRARAMGESLHVEISIHVDAKLLVYEADIIVELLRDSIKKNIDSASEISIYSSPFSQ
ncbi:MAG: cation transporter [Magnetococcales bacterium]|nr:cation transporter [Magnetococcales bacterium]